MRKISLFGFGMIGQIIAKEISLNWDIDEIVIIDLSEENLKKIDSLIKELKEKDRNIKITVLKKDVINEKDDIVRNINGSLIGIGALPHNVEENALKICLEAEINFIDLVYDRYLENSENLDSIAKRSGIVIIPAMGVAPGLSNAMVANGIQKFDQVDSVKIFVGGVPQTRIPPLDYQIVFSASSVINEYSRDVNLRRDGKNIKVPAMSEVEPIHFLSYKDGNFEAFLTDGLSTLLKTYPNIKNIEEKTVRWSGHAEKINLLSQLDLLSFEKLKINKTSEIAPAEILTKLFEKKLKMEKKYKDMTLMKIEILGLKNNKKFLYIQELFDVYDELGSETSMARTTGYSCIFVAKMIVEKKIKEIGFLPPEKAIIGELYNYLVEELKKKKIIINDAMLELYS